MPKNSLIILAVIIAVTIIVSIFLFAMLGSTDLQKQLARSISPQHKHCHWQSS